MKKRILSLALALCMLCALLTACGEPAKEKTTAEILSEAVEKTEVLDSVSAQMKIEMEMEAEGISMSIPMSIDLKCKDAKSENPTIWVRLNTELFGQSMEIEVYQEDQWSYMVMGDMKYKSKSEDATDEFDYSDDILKDLPDELLEGVAPVKNEDGSQTITISVPDDKFAEIYNDLIESINTDESVDLSQIKISDAVVKITVNNGYIIVYDMSFVMEMTVEDVTTKTEVKASITYDNPGEPVEITPPEGYKDFEEQEIEE